MLLRRNTSAVPLRISSSCVLKEQQGGVALVVFEDFLHRFGVEGCDGIPLTDPSIFLRRQAQPGPPARTSLRTRFSAPKPGENEAVDGQN